MKKPLAVSLLVAVTLAGSTAAAKSVKVDAVGQFIEEFSLEIFDARPGKGVVASGSVCMQSLVVKNGSAVKQEVQFDSYGKTGSTLEASAVEVIEPGGTLNILDRGEAGDNIQMFRFDTTNSLDKATPMIIGKTGGDKCTPVDVTMFKAGADLSGKVNVTGDSPTVLEFKQGNDNVVRFMVEISGVNAGAFTAELGAPLGLGTGWGFPPE